MYFDILLLDDEACLSKSYRERRDLLSKTVNPVYGRSGIAEQDYINFALPGCDKVLLDFFAMAAAQRWEGLVLKASKESYFTLPRQGTDEFHGKWIKLKKDYIPGLGDTADFAIIGARYDSREALNLRQIKNLRWTSFFVGCIDSERTASRHSSTRPVYRVVDVISSDNLHPQIIQTLNQYGQFRCSEYDEQTSPFKIYQDQVQHPQMDVIFKKPFVVEMLGSGFEKPQNTRYYVLRFPRVIKIHSDREAEEAITFKGLQKLAKDSLSVPADGMSQEVSRWTEKLVALEGQPEYIVERSEDSFSDVLNQSTKSSVDGLNPQPSEQPVARIGLQSSSMPSSYSKPTVHCSSPSEENKLRVKQQDSVSSVSGTRKRPRSRSPHVIVLPDDTQSTASTSGKTTSGQHNGCHERHLADLTNISANKHFKSSDRESIKTSCDSKKSSTSQRMDSSFNTTPKTSQHIPNGKPGLGHNGGDEHNSKGIIRHEEKLFSKSSPPLVAFDKYELRLPRILINFPVFCGREIPRDRIYSVTSNCKKQSRFSCPTIRSFLFNVLSGGPNNSPFACHAGIVLVDADDSHANNVAEDITDVGNALSELQKAGQLFGAGVIIFLHWETAQHRTMNNSMTEYEDMRKWWKTFGNQSFVGCLKWGLGDLKDTREEKDRSKAKGHTAVASSSGAPAGDVTVSWVWRDILSLL